MRVGLPVVAALLLGGAAVAARPPNLRDVLQHAGRYADRYHHEFTTVVAEERYVQRIEGGEVERTLRSDFVLIRGTPGELSWLSFRDIFEVDGTPVSGERGRLERWLAERRYGFTARARALALEQARYNLGDVVRTINVPLLALEFLLPKNQKRFRFRAHGSEPVGDTATLRATYEERRRPTIIRTPGGPNVEARGTLWIEPSTGRVFRTELRTGARDRRQVNATITVTYAPHARLEMLVPVLMEERYETPSETITGIAAYSNFRRFEIDARIKSSAQIQPCPRPDR